MSTPAPNPPTHLISKLKQLRSRLKIWNREVFQNVYTEIQHTADLLDQIQQRTSNEGNSEELFEWEMNQISKLNGLLAHHQALLFQKNRLQWLQDRDRNSTFFHRLHSTKKSRASIKMVQVGDLDSEIGNHVVSYYENSSQMMSS